MSQPKKYQNVSYRELLAFASSNPNRTHALTPIERNTSSDIPEKTLELIGLSLFTSVNLNPAGILSIFAYIKDPNYYSFAPMNLRTEMIIDLATTLQEQTDELKNTSLGRKRKRIHELIAMAYNHAAFEDKDYYDLFHALSMMKDIHFILIKDAKQEHYEGKEEKEKEKEDKEKDEEKKGDVFFSSDPRNWKRDHPLWVVDYRAQWIANSDTDEIYPHLPTWFSYLEEHQWIVHWPEVDGTKVELVQQLSEFPSWNELDKKLVKDVLSVRLGREKTIQLFEIWNN
jgi:hypothetical protein